MKVEVLKTPRVIAARRLLLSTVIGLESLYYGVYVEIEDGETQISLGRSKDKDAIRVLGENMSLLLGLPLHDELY